jgi:hypothetical protein
MKTTLNLAMAAALIGLTSSSLMAEPTDCLKLAVTVKNEIKAQPAKVLEIVENQVAANEDCACEVVKAAIQSTEAKGAEVAGIVEVAATAAPAKMRLIAQCAVAVAPDSLAKVQVVLAKLDPNRGEGPVTSEKGGMDKNPIPPAALPNPLDFPVGPGAAVLVPLMSNGISAGGGLIPGLPPGQPPVVTPPVTGVRYSWFYGKSGSSGGSGGGLGGGDDEYEGS